MVVEVTTNLPMAVRLSHVLGAMLERDGEPPHVLLELADRTGVTRGPLRSLRTRTTDRGRLDLILSGIDPLDERQLLRQLYADLSADTNGAAMLRDVDPVLRARLETWVEEDRRRG